jgi:hypothetical protein
MSDALEQVKQTISRATQPCLSQGATHITDDIAKDKRIPKVVITGDIRFRVSESDAALRPVKGSYRVDMEDVQEPLEVLWGAEGQVQRRQARATDITFEMPGARAGQTWTYLVQVQVTDRWRSITSGVFIQILVTRDDLATERGREGENSYEW